MTTFGRSEMLDSLPEQFFVNLTSEKQKVANQGHDVIDLGRGNPDTATPQFIVQALQKAAEDPDNHKYAPFRGFSYLKESVAEFYKTQYDVNIDPDKEVAVLFGSRIGLIELSQCLLNPGDTVLLPNPGYPDYETGVALAKAKMEHLPLRKENNYLPDYDAMQKELLERAKLMYLNYPNNPTAAVATSEFFDETIDVAKKHKICVVHDFAYGAFGFDEEKPISFLQSEGAKEVGVETYTLSKTYNMAGWRVAFVVGNSSVVEHINKLQDHLYSGIFGAIQYAAAEALTSDQSSVKELKDLYENRRNAFMQKINEIGWKAEAPESTFFVWLPVPKDYSSEEFSNLLLKEAHVATAPGSGFGTEGEGYVRIGLLDSEERLIEAAERIGKLNLFK